MHGQENIKLLPSGITNKLNNALYVWGTNEIHIGCYVAYLGCF